MRNGGQRMTATFFGVRYSVLRSPFSVTRLPGLLFLLFLALSAASIGCRTARHDTAQLPAEHSVRAEQLQVISDIKLKLDHPLIQDLIQLRKDVAEQLQLPLEGRDVVVYVFGDKTKYQQYLDATYPGLPPRRAYFVGTPRELAVYTFWGDSIQEDLRHEFTHGLLHAQLKDVPLWLDEGLAEYFELPRTTPNAVNREYARKLGIAIANNWEPDLERLESLQDVIQMQRADYQEAWAWVHFLLHNSDDSREVLLNHLQELRENPHPAPLSTALRDTLPEVNARYLAHLSTLNAIQPVSHQP